MNPFSGHPSSLQEIDQTDGVQGSTVDRNILGLLFSSEQIHVWLSFPGNFEMLVEIGIIDRIHPVDRLFGLIALVLGGLVHPVGDEVSAL